MVVTRLIGIFVLIGMLMAGCGAVSLPQTDTAGSSVTDSTTSGGTTTGDTGDRDDGDSDTNTPANSDTHVTSNGAPLPSASPPPNNPYPPPADPYSPPPNPTPNLTPDPSPDPAPDPKPNPKPDPTPTPPPPKACAHYPMGTATLPAAKTGCGNGTVESGESCDDGNTLGNDGCTADCTKAITTSPKPQVCTAGTPIVQVTTAAGQPLPGATVTLYIDTSEADNPLHERFPQTAFPSEQIAAVGTTNAQGQWVVPAAILTHSGKYLIHAAASGYLPQFTASPTCGSFTKTTVATLALTSLSSYAATPGTPDTTHYPVRVDNFHYSFFEREDREIVFPYVPSVRSSLCPTLASVDITLHILGAPMPDFFPQGIPPESLDLNYHQKVAAKNVTLFQMNAFRFQLPVGVYYFYFEFTLHHDDTTTETQMFYPVRPGYTTYPALIAGAAPTSGNSLFGTFDSELLVYPAETLASFPESQAAELTPIAVPAPDGKARIPIVIMNSGFDAAEFLALATEMVKGSSLAMSGVAPFDGTMSRFAIYASTANFTTNDAAWPLSNNWGVLSGTVPLTKSQKVYMNAALEPKPLLFLLVKDPTVASGTKAGSGFCEFKNGTSISISSTEYTSCMQTSGSTATTCAKNLNLARIFLHELGHELGMLGEEYYENKSAFFDVNDYETKTGHFFTPYYKPNTAFPTGLDVGRVCHQTLFSYGSAPAQTILCADVGKTALCDHVPWHDLVRESDVGCYLGGGPDTGRSYPNLLKPQRHSIMDFGGNFSSVPLASYNGHVYGLANERSLCRAIRAHTATASDGCKALCLDGCPAGTRCDLKGMCVKK